MQPGAYEASVESFCLHAGTHGPSSGDGYLYAPLKGSKAEIIHGILLGAAEHRDIPQTAIQMLIWSIEARAKLKNLPPNLQIAAAKLLSKAELLDLNGGALGLIPDAVWKKALQSAPPEARRLLETQATIRNKLASAGTTFKEIEQLAVLARPPDHDGIKTVRGRWSSHPGGFFVRYLPDGYTKMKIQVYVPTQSAWHSSKSSFPGMIEVSSTTVEFDLTEDVAVPADTNAQRLGLSDVPLYSGDDRGHGHYGQADGHTEKEACDKATLECTSTIKCSAGSKIELTGNCACYKGGTLGQTCMRYCKCKSSGLPVSWLDDHLKF